MDDANDVTLDQVVQAMVLDAIARGSDQTRIALRGDELQASYFDSVEFRVGISVPAEWFDRVEQRLKLMANILLSDPRVPQRGRFRRPGAPDPTTRLLDNGVTSFRKRP